MAFWSSRVVLAAVEFGVFTQLAAGPLSGQELMDQIGWHPRAAGPVLDALVALGLLLFVISFVVLAIAKIMLLQLQKQAGG